MTELTTVQKAVIKLLVETAKEYADGISKVMNAFGLNWNGCRFSVSITPSGQFFTEMVSLTTLTEDDMHVTYHYSLARGRLTDGEWETGDDDTIKHEGTLADACFCAGKTAGADGEKPLPPDGLWISNCDDCPPADCGVSMNGSMA